MPDLLQINQNMLVPRDKIAAILWKTYKGKRKLYASVDGGIYVVEEEKAFMDAYNRQPRGVDQFHVSL